MDSVAVVCAAAAVIPTAYRFVTESICFDFLRARIADENVIVRKVALRLRSRSHCIAYARLGGHRVVGRGVLLLRLLRRV
jgi:hypothetical protein